MLCVFKYGLAWLCVWEVRWAFILVPVTKSCVAAPPIHAHNVKKKNEKLSRVPYTAETPLCLLTDTRMRALSDRSIRTNS